MSRNRHSARAWKELEAISAGAPGRLDRCSVVLDSPRAREIAGRARVAARRGGPDQAAKAVRAPLGRSIGWNVILTIAPFQCCSCLSQLMRRRCYPSVLLFPGGPDRWLVAALRDGALDAALDRAALRHRGWRLTLVRRLVRARRPRRPSLMAGRRRPTAGAGRTAAAAARRTLYARPCAVGLRRPRRTMT